MLINLVDPFIMPIKDGVKSFHSSTTTKLLIYSYYILHYLSITLSNKKQSIVIFNFFYSMIHPLTLKLKLTITCIINNGFNIKYHTSQFLL